MRDDFLLGHMRFQQLGAQVWLLLVHNYWFSAWLGRLTVASVLVAWCLEAGVFGGLGVLGGFNV